MVENLESSHKNKLMYKLLWLRISNSPLYNIFIHVFKFAIFVTNYTVNRRILNYERGTGTLKTITDNTFTFQVMVHKALMYAPWPKLEFEWGYRIKPYNMPIL